MRTIAAMSTARRTALLSFLAALALVATKLLVGLATSSLGILAEALHSGLDAVAALLSLYAVGVAERPPDEQHQYGHGKAQHLAALSEAAILAAVAIWIGFEAVMRLRSGGGDVQPEWYAFVLLFGVLIVDAARWSVSFRTGTRERNAALLASAWHFASDFAGTTAVLIGLALVSAGYPRADAVAALTVAALVLVAAARLAAAQRRCADGPRAQRARPADRADRPGGAGRCRGAVGARAGGRRRELRRRGDRRLPARGAGAQPPDHGSGRGCGAVADRARPR